MIYGFETSNNLKLSDIGGKAKSLIESTIERFNVPTGIVLSVEYFKHWNEIIEATPLWNKLIESPIKEKEYYNLSDYSREEERNDGKTPKRVFFALKWV